MKVFAISDLHLSSAVGKPMDIFGDGWLNHFERVRENWLSLIGEDDLVLLGGDMSWGLTIEEAAPDYAAVAELPGQKVVVKGNHDYYWTSLGKMQAAFPSFGFVQNNCLRRGKFLITGTRGWNLPSEDSSEHDLKIYRRELLRLELSLKCAEKAKTEDDVVIAMLHYPPFDAKYGDSEVTALLEKYGVRTVTYGHLHGKNARVTHVVRKNDADYYLTSCDLVNNTPVRIF